ncbi:MAG: tripartite tricarboxylate transporter permease, partial [Lysobacterales bacterium]
MVWVVVILSATFGVFIGSIPGLTATMAVALLVPITYWLEPEVALAAVVTMVACAIFAGDIPTTLLRIPGTPASAAYADDAKALTNLGKSDTALGVALVCSVAGGLFGAMVLMGLGHQLAKIATVFSAVEYFWLYLLGLSSAVVVSSGPKLRALLSLTIGLLLSTVGLSAVHSQARFTFGQPELFDGIGFIPAMIGLFGVSEVLKNLIDLQQGQTESTEDRVGAENQDSSDFGLMKRFVYQPIKSVLGSGSELLLSRKWHALRSGG